MRSSLLQVIPWHVVTRQWRRKGRRGSPAVPSSSRLFRRVLVVRNADCNAMQFREAMRFNDSKSSEAHGGSVDLSLFPVHHRNTALIRQPQACPPALSPSRPSQGKRENVCTLPRWRVLFALPCIDDPTTASELWSRISSRDDRIKMGRKPGRDKLLTCLQSLRPSSTFVRPSHRALLGPHND